MIGVVLWSDPVDLKAVFWCEDQGDLAYFDGTKEDTEYDAAFEAGDMVQFDLELDRKLRKAVDARLIKQKVCTGLQEQLRNSAAGTRTDLGAKAKEKVVALKRRGSSAILPFRKLKA